MSSPISDLETPLLQHLNGLFAAEGFADLTMGKLAARLKCSRRALYELAPTKDALLVKVVKRNYQHHLDDVKTAVYEQVDPMDRLSAFFDVIRVRNEQLTEPFHRDVIATPSTNSVRLAHVSQMLTVLEGIIRDGMARGVFRPQNPELTTTLAFGLLQMVDDPQLRERIGDSYTALFDQTIDFFLNGVLDH